VTCLLLAQITFDATVYGLPDPTGLIFPQQVCKACSPRIIHRDTDVIDDLERIQKDGSHAKQKERSE
jgi:hypothetical protein